MPCRSLPHQATVVCRRFAVAPLCLRPRVCASMPSSQVLCARAALLCVCVCVCTNATAVRPVAVVPLCWRPRVHLCHPCKRCTHDFLCVCAHACVSLRACCRICLDFQLWRTAACPGPVSSVCCSALRTVMRQFVVSYVLHVAAILAAYTLVNLPHTPLLLCGTCAASVGHTAVLCRKGVPLRCVTSVLAQMHTDLAAACDSRVAPAATLFRVAACRPTST